MNKSCDSSFHKFVVDQECRLWFGVRVKSAVHQYSQTNLVFGLLHFALQLIFMVTSMNNIEEDISSEFNYFTYT